MFWVLDVDDIIVSEKVYSVDLKREERGVLVRNKERQADRRMGGK